MNLFNRKFGFWSCALTIVAVSACVHQPLVPPERGGAPWTEITSAHFVLKTDLDSRTAEEVSTKLEEIFAALAEFGFSSARQPQLRIGVVYLRSREEYVLFAPKLTDGVFLRLGRHDFERTPLAILGGDFVQATRETVQHELTHLFVQFYYPQAPTWLNEGLARYMETMSIDDGLVVLGRQSRKQHFWNGPLAWRSDSSGPTELLPVSEVPSPAELRAMSPAQFYGQHDLDPTTRDGRRAAVTAGVHYEAASSLVRLLLTNDTYTSLFGKYLERIHDGASEGAAWQETLGRMSAQGLAEDYRQALVPKEVLLVRAKWRAPPYAAERNRPMTGSEVHALWAQLRPDTPEGRSAAQTDLAEAHRLGEAAEDLPLVEAYWLAETRQFPDAKELLRQALVAHGDDPRLWNAFGRLTVQAAVQGTGRLSAGTLQAIAEIAAHLAPIARSAAEFDLLANVSESQGNLDEALAYEKHAVAVDPNCVPCLIEAAQIFVRKDQVREALATATLAQGLVPDGAHSLQLDELLVQCRVRLTKEAGPPPAASNASPGGSSR